MKRILFLAFILITASIAEAQVAISNTTVAPDASSMLDVQSASKGVLIPRLTMAQRDSIVTPADGLLIYQKDTLQGLYFYNNGWKAVSDNLGSHKMTQALNMNNNRIYNNNVGTGIRLDSEGGFTVRVSTYSNPLPHSSLVVDPYGGLVVRGTVGDGYIPATGLGERMMWHAAKGSFRAGGVDSYQWDEGNIGYYSAAFGRNTIASGMFSFASGDSSEALQNFAAAMGNRAKAETVNSFAFGYNAKARGNNSYALGYGVQAFGSGSAVVGMYNDTILASPQGGPSAATPVFIVGTGDNATTRTNGLVVQKDGRVYIDPSDKNNGSVGDNALVFGRANNSGEGISSKRTEGGNRYGLDFYTGFTNRMSITQSGNVGLGTSTPTFPLTFGNTLGNKIAFWTSSPTNYYGIGVQNQNLQIFTDLSISDVSFGYGNSSAFTETMRIKGNGNVGIGTSAPSQKLTVAGNICATGSIGACSDIRYKTNLAPVTNALTSLLSIHGIYYNWKPEFKDKGFTKDRQIGFSAQEVEKVIPEMVQTDNEGYKSVDYSRMAPVLVEAVREQQKIIDEKSKKIEELEERLKRVEVLLQR